MSERNFILSIKTVGLLMKLQIIYIKTNSLGHIIHSFGIHVSELTNDERTLEAVMMDMMTRSMAARGFDMRDVSEMVVS